MKFPTLKISFQIFYFCNMKLFTPLQLKNHTLQNRIVVSPMCQYSSKDGFASDFHMMHYGQFSGGKVGLIIQEATAVLPNGRISFADLGLWNDEQIDNLKRIVDLVHQNGSLMGIQLAHAGRKASCNVPWGKRGQLPPDNPNGWQTIAPTAEGFYPDDIPPITLTLEGIKEIVLAFKKASERAVRAGYDVIEIHGAHGYLLHQFLSPLINKRTDDYGGTFENRIRLLLEVVEAVKETLTTQSLWVRISATDWAEGGWDLEESIKLCRILKSSGVEVMDISTGGAVHHQEIPIKENYQVPFAEKIKAETGICTGTVGLITSGKQAEQILQNNQADFVLVGRGFLQNPHLPYQWAKELNQDIEWLPQYRRGKENY